MVFSLVLVASTVIGSSVVCALAARHPGRHQQRRERNFTETERDAPVQPPMTAPVT